MTTGFYTAATGAISQKQAVDVTANNLANLSTQGYKADHASFADLLYTNVKDETGDSGLKVGHGAKVAKTDTLYELGGLRQTGNPQDYALTGARNFFAVRTPDGAVKYTRNGSFQKVPGGDGNYYLADPEGGFVLDQAGNPIVFTGDIRQAQPVGVYTFANLGGLLKAGESYCTPTALSGAASAVPGAEVRQGYLEDSAASLSNELSNMIVQQRAFEMDAKMVQMTDEVMQTVNNLR